MSAIDLMFPEVREFVDKKTKCFVRAPFARDRGRGNGVGIWFIHLLCAYTAHAWAGSGEFVSGVSGVSGVSNLTRLRG
jgi:hypothetical protein